ncbi:protein kinase domain-containing protein [Nocardia macrotermitis]|uniref:non-specific serine/threonine protein kinase n=1 Tax=Nocardia macrotermitis TaxID=2585198 RepID=A0A7K0DB74_9NOCA|nr:protein kinase [Nocardia macrotermitis]MQY23046.1 Serine/threonine-protein kinase PknD [Nocardia macrotermitis]
MLTNGAMIADRYRLQRLIATGGMGQVWEALDTRLDRRVAVKVLKAEFSADPTFRQRFRTEAKTTAQLNHPGIAGIYDYGETMDPQGGETAYLVMELVQGEPLNAVLNRLGRLSVVQGLDMLEQTSRALEVAHAAGVVHRDVKPGNILVTPTGQVKITDFGIAKAVDASPVTKTGMVMGTAQYIAPEQATGEDATSASDVYSLGVVGYEALAGQRPFSGDGALTVAMKHVRDTPPPMPSDLPPNVRELIEITMTKDPTRRYHSGGEFADAVAAVRSGRRPPMPRGMGGPSTPQGGAARVLPPPTGATTVLPRDYDDRYPNSPRPQGRPTGVTSAMGGHPDDDLPYDDEPGMSRPTKWLLGLGIGALVLGGAAAWVLLSGSPPQQSVTPVVTHSTTTAPVTTTTEAPTTTDEPTTTRYVPPVETTRTTPPTTTTTPPSSSTTTSDSPTTTTTGRHHSTQSPWDNGDSTYPSVEIPTLPGVPGMNGYNQNGYNQNGYHNGYSQNSYPDRHSHNQYTDVSPPDTFSQGQP